MIYLILLFIILFSILAWRRLDLAVMLLIASLPAYLIRFNILGLPFTLLEAMIWAVFLVWFFKSCKYIIENLKLRIGNLFKIENLKLKINNRYPFDFEIVLLLFIALVSVGVAGFSNSSFGIFKAYFFEPIMLFIVVLNVMKGGKGREKILMALALSALAVSALAIYQKITGQLIDNSVWAATETRRVVSFFGYPNAVGLYLGPIILIMIGWLASVISRNIVFLSSSSERQRGSGIHKDETQINLDCSSVLTSVLKKKTGCLRGNDKNKLEVWNDKEKLVARNDKIKIILISFAIIASLLSIYFAKSKGALVGVAVGLIIFGLLASKPIRRATVIFLIIVSLGISVYKPARNLAVENITLTNLSGQIRKAGWSDAWRMLKDDRLLTGAGLANFKASVEPYHSEGIFFKDFSDTEAQRKLVFNEAYRTAHWQPLEIYLYPHNIFLNFWSELGLAGMLLFIWIIGKFFVIGVWNLFGNWKLEIGNLETRKNKYLILGLLGAMTAIVIHGVVDVPYFKNDLAVMFWLFVAMMSMIKLESINY